MLLPKGIISFLDNPFKLSCTLVANALSKVLVPLSCQPFLFVVNSCMCELWSVPLGSHRRDVSKHALNWRVRALLLSREISSGAEIMLFTSSRPCQLNTQLHTVTISSTQPLWNPLPSYPRTSPLGFAGGQVYRKTPSSD